MKIPIVFFISTRYICASGGGYLSKVMSGISVIGTGLSVAILLCIMSIMNGFEAELKSRTLGPGSHLDVLIPKEDDEPVERYLSLIKSDEGVLDAVSVTEANVLASYNGVFRNITLRGLEPSSKYFNNTIFPNTSGGVLHDLAKEEFGIVLGVELADALGVDVGDYVSLTLPQPLIYPVGLFPRSKRFQVVSIFKFGLGDPDGSLAFIRRDTAATFLPEAMRFNLISVLLLDTDASTSIAKKIELRSNLKVDNWKDKHSVLFRALQIEKLVMFTILFMAVLIALLNMTSILLVNVTSKKKDIAILVSLGIARKDVAKIFFYQGLITGVLGLMLGLSMGVLLSIQIDSLVGLVEHTLDFKVLSPQVYYISSIPSQLLAKDVFLIGGISLFSVFFGALGPALLSAKMNPIRGLRSE